jgi:hypothetical protein
MISAIKVKGKMSEKQEILPIYDTVKRIGNGLVVIFYFNQQNNEEKGFNQCKLPLLLNWITNFLLPYYRY